MPEQTPSAQLTRLSRRATAAVIDMSVIGLLCFGLQWAMRLAEPPRRSPAIACGVVLAVLMLVEMLTGFTLGKLFTRLRVRQSDRTRAPIHSLIIRATARELPVAIFIPSLWVGDEMSLLIWGISLSVVCCYVAAAYLVLVRIGKTPFDSAAGTIVE